MVLQVIKRPDFLIVQAPKCGTTAMYTYLKQHPEIFMPKLTETAFFSTDFCHPNPKVHTLEKYLSLFRKVSDEKRVGEYSTSYFYSKNAAKEIKKFNPSASIIIMLRNPVDMMYSLHNHMCYLGMEDLVNFEHALNAEEKRKKELCSTKLVGPVEMLFYKEIAKFTPKVKLYLDLFGCDNVHIIIFDDFKRNAAEAYRKVLKFLGVNQDFKPDYKIANPSAGSRSKTLDNFIENPPQSVRKLVNAVMPLSLVQWLFACVKNRINKKSMPYPPMDPVLRKRLQTECASDIEQLSEMLGRDLTNWGTD